MYRLKLWCLAAYSYQDEDRHQNRVKHNGCYGRHLNRIPEEALVDPDMLEALKPDSDMDEGDDGLYRPYKVRRVNTDTG